MLLNFFDFRAHVPLGRNVGTEPWDVQFSTFFFLDATEKALVRDSTSTQENSGSAMLPLQRSTHSCQQHRGNYIPIRGVNVSPFK